MAQTREFYLREYQERYARVIDLRDVKPPPLPLDDLRLLYDEVRDSRPWGLEAHYSLLRAVLNPVRYALLGHPALERVAVTGRLIGDKRFSMEMPGNTASTFLIHYFGGGLDGDDRFVVERIRAHVDGDIRPVEAGTANAKGQRKAKRVVVSREEAEASGNRKCWLSPAVPVNLSVFTPPWSSVSRTFAAVWVAARTACTVNPPDTALSSVTVARPESEFSAKL